MPGCIQTLGWRRAQGLDQTDWQTLQGPWQLLWTSSYDFSTWCKTSAALRLTLLKKEMTSPARSAFCYTCRRWEHAAVQYIAVILSLCLGSPTRERLFLIHTGSDREKPWNASSSSPRIVWKRGYSTAPTVLRTGWIAFLWNIAQRSHLWPGAPDNN